MLKKSNEIVKNFGDIEKNAEFPLIYGQEIRIALNSVILGQFIFNHHIEILLITQSDSDGCAANIQGLSELSNLGGGQHLVG